MLGVMLSRVRSLIFYSIFDRIFSSADGDISYGARYICDVFDTLLIISNNNIWLDVAIS